MKLDQVIAVRPAKTVYRDGDRCIKVFNENYSKADILNEALNQARVEETGLNIPKIIEVTKVDGRWAIVSEFIEGKTLAALMEEFQTMPNVGFCWDTGHEQCYNRGKDMMALYGDRLIATHFNDNLGVSRYDGEIFWTDDLHLLPYDGITDWQSVADRINSHGYEGILTFELSIGNKPHRRDNEKYAKLSPEEYLAEAYARACRLGAAVLRGKG